MVWTFRGLRYRYLKSRPANEDNSIVAKGYAIADINYEYQSVTFGVSIENLLNTKWNETQFATESRLKKSLIVLKKFILPWNTLFYESKITYKF
jgi:outer membrane receptor protein involved in Fe transport